MSKLVNNHYFMSKLSVQIILLFIFVSILSCTPKEKKQDEIKDSTIKTSLRVPTTTIAYTDTLFDFGNVSSGDTVFHKFSFRNSGNNPMVIKDASSMCGCTIPTWSNAQIAPGDTGSITVAFSKKGDYGPHKREVIVKANTIPEYTMLHIKALVK